MGLGVYKMGNDCVDGAVLKVFDLKGNPISEIEFSVDDKERMVSTLLSIHDKNLFLDKRAYITGSFTFLDLLCRLDKEDIEKMESVQKYSRSMDD